MGGKTARQLLLLGVSPVIVLVSGLATSASGPMLGIRELDDQGLRLQSAVVGYTLGPIVPLVSYDRYHADLSIALSERTAWGSSSLTVGTDLAAQVPAAGVKVRLGGVAARQAVPFVLAVVGKPMLSIRLRASGDVPPDFEESLGQLEEEIRKRMPSMWLVRGAFGGDYMVSESLAITAEFGLQYFTAATKHTDSMDFDSDGVSDWTITTALKSAFDATYTSVGLTYYF